MWKAATLKLTINYSLIFLGFLALFSSILYIWVSKSLNDGLVEQVRGQVEQTDKTGTSTQQDVTARVATDIAIDQFRNILLIVDGVAILLVPFGAYFLTRRALKPLIVSQEQQKQFIANASHELRTPLAVIGGELELALRKSQSVNDYKQTISSSKQEVDHMIHLTRELLLLAQLDEVGSRLPETTTVDLFELIHVVNKRLAPIAQRKSVTVTINCQKGTAVMGSPTLIDIAIGNLVDNAIKYSVHGGNVAITVNKLPQNHALISIEDDGPGIALVHQKQLFDRFYQAKNNRNSEGFGLGLAIAKRIITLHNGKISFTSSSRGTIFNITI